MLKPYFRTVLRIRVVNWRFIGPSILSRDLNYMVRILYGYYVVILWLLYGFLWILC